MYVDDTTKDIMSKERVHRTRLTVLQSSGKVKVLTCLPLSPPTSPCFPLFASPLQSFSNIFSLLQSVKARDEGKGGEGGASQPFKAESNKPTRNPAPHTQGYSRYEQEVYQGKAGEWQYFVRATESDKCRLSDLLILSCGFFQNLHMHSD